MPTPPRPLRGFVGTSRRWRILCRPRCTRPPAPVRSRPRRRRPRRCCPRRRCRRCRGCRRDRRCCRRRRCRRCRACRHDRRCCHPSWCRHRHGSDRDPRECHRRRGRPPPLRRPPRASRPCGRRCPERPTRSSSEKSSPAVLPTPIRAKAPPTIRATSIVGFIAATFPLRRPGPDGSGEGLWLPRATVGAVGETELGAA